MLIKGLYPWLSYWIENGWIEKCLNQHNYFCISSFRGFLLLQNNSLSIEMDVLRGHTAWPNYPEGMSGEFIVTRAGSVQVKEKLNNSYTVVTLSSYCLVRCLHVPVSSIQAMTCGLGSEFLSHRIQYVYKITAILEWGIISWEKVKEFFYKSLWIQRICLRTLNYRFQRNV